MMYNKLPATNPIIERDMLSGSANIKASVIPIIVEIDNKILYPWFRFIRVCISLSAEALISACSATGMKNIIPVNMSALKKNNTETPSKKL